MKWVWILTQNSGMQKITLSFNKDQYLCYFKPLFGSCHLWERGSHLVLGMIYLGDPYLSPLSYLD